SLADLYLTWQLFETEGAAAGERNPVADWILTEYGWAGVAGLKLCTVLLVALLAAVICRFRPQTATRLLTGCCALLGSVVVYSCLLLYFPGTVSADSMALERHIYEDNQVLDAAMRQSQDRIKLKQGLAHELLTQKRSLADAVAVVTAVEEPDSVRIKHM